MSASLVSAAAVAAAPDAETAEVVSATMAMRPLMDLPGLRWAPPLRRVIVCVTFTPWTRAILWLPSGRARVGGRKT